ncbi:MAG: NERD domain-containing protein [Bacilli bacterium]|nr:NERD domain-containing protein [Bacilli bacterium]
MHKNDSLLNQLYKSSVKRNHAKNSGKIGEARTNYMLDYLPEEKYIVLDNLLLKNDDITCQIDHLVISAFGIFVIETKNYEGFFVGDNKNKYWYKYLGKERYQCLNPIVQNNGHIIFLSKLLKLNQNKFFNIVCIPSNAKLHIKNNGELCRFDNLLTKIIPHKEIIITNVLDILDIIIDASSDDKEDLREHIDCIKDKYFN